MFLESRSNIKSWFRVCLWRIRHYDEPVIPRRFLLLLFLTFKNQISTIKLSSNHLLKVNQIEQLLVGTILYFYYFGKTVHLRFCSSLVKWFWKIIDFCIVWYYQNHEAIFESRGDFDNNNKFLYSLMLPKSCGDCINNEAILTAQKP